MVAPLDRAAPRVHPTLRLILAASLLAWAGCLICFLLLPRDGAPLLCPSSGGCAAVFSSAYAALLGVPLPWIGGGFYLLVLVLLLVALGHSAPALKLRVLNIALWACAAGATFSAALMVVQFAKLRAFCPLCTASALVVAALAVTLWNALARCEDGQVHEPAPLLAWTLAAFAALTAAALLLQIVASPATGPGDEKLQIDLTTAQVFGPRDAPVQLVVFSDFQCDFCAQLALVLRQAREEFGTEVLIAYRHYPLEVHPRAFAAAEAAECAAEQGAFWAYHDLLHAGGGELSDQQFLALAAELSLDAGKFRECRESGRAANTVRASHSDAVMSGLEGVPALFLNGQRIGGVIAYEKLRAQIRAQLTAPRVPLNQTAP